jgi:hypothetical protein
LAETRHVVLVLEEDAPSGQEVEGLEGADGPGVKLRAVGGRSKSFYFILKLVIENKFKTGVLMT